MHWQKLGQLYTPVPTHPKLVSHAANPLAILLEEDIYRVFFSGRDVQNRSSIGFVDIDILKREVIFVCEKPVFEHGSENSFYSHGVSIGNCYEVDGQRYILFMGWQCSPGEHWRGDIGSLRLNYDFSIQLDSAEPLMGCDDVDQFSLSYPWVVRENELYLMWYGSTLTWDAGNGEMLHVINFATSIDGYQWKRLGLSVPYKLGVAQAFSRPTVISDQAGYHMWFSYRSGKPRQTYRIGYAHSTSGKNWQLQLDDAGIDVSQSGWDSEMIEYPFVFDHKGQRLMLSTVMAMARRGLDLRC